MMIRVLRPKIKERGAGTAVAGGQDDWTARLASYIPLPISGAYPLLDNALTAYAKEPLAQLGIAPWVLGWFVFVALLVLAGLDVNKAYNKKGLRGRTRWRIQIVQTVMMVIAFFLWTYSLHGSVWGSSYSAALSLILSIIFLLATAYVPAITPAEADQSGFDNLQGSTPAETDRSGSDNPRSAALAQTDMSTSGSRQ